MYMVGHDYKQRYFNVFVVFRKFQQLLLTVATYDRQLHLIIVYLTEKVLHIVGAYGHKVVSTRIIVEIGTRRYSIGHYYSSILR